VTSKWKFTEDQIDRALGLLKGAASSAPITSERLGDSLGLEDIEGNWKARILVSEVMLRRRVPVVSRSHGKPNQRGYWIPQNQEEVNEYVRDLHRRAAGDMSRAATVEVLWREAHPDSELESRDSLEEY
jgi:hypothetical protein